MNDSLPQAQTSELALQNPVPPMASKKTVERLIGKAKTLAQASRSPATKRAYQSDLVMFRDWCATHQLSALPAAPQTVALYAAALHEQGRAVATIRRRMIALAVEHRQRQLPDPTEHEMVRDVFKGIRRIAGIAQVKKKPLRGDELKAMILAQPDTVRGWRDRAILLLGYSAALRRSELASLRVEWIRAAQGGITIVLPTSKTDQEGAGTMIVVEAGADPARCPVAVLGRYLEKAKITSGAMFRSIDRHGNLSAYALDAKSVAQIVQRHVKEILREDPGEYGAHSLRAGFATILDERGVSLTQIMRRGRWKSERIARGYIRSEDWREPLNGKLEL